MDSVNTTPESVKSLPDVASHRADTALNLPIQRVGMGHIQVPVLYSHQDRQIHAAADVDAYVSLDLASARGIHMSRMFRVLQEMLPVNALTVNLLKQLSTAFLESHSNLSSTAELVIRWPLLLQRKALKSDNSAWRTYPVAVFAEKTQKSFQWGLEFQVLYSSTCPASAALSRDLIQTAFRSQFADRNLDLQSVESWLGSTDGIVATPHAQRSVARVQLMLSEQAPLDVSYWINLVEETLQTPVQTAVKREDEQEFALRNGQNLMFCEDANRKLQSALREESQVQGFRLEIRHLESLHPHDAVAMSSYGSARPTFVLELPQNL